MAVPSTKEWRSIAKSFEEWWNFPLCCGALNTKHVILKAPPNSGSHFYNYKGTFSLVLLVVVDTKYCFWVIDVGGYGKKVMMGFWPTQLLVRYFKLVPSNCLLNGYY